MVKVCAENGSLKVTGTFDFGYMGFYTDDEIACFLTDYINLMEKKICDNIGYINDSFLENIYGHMDGIGWQFWVYNKEVTITELMLDDPDFDTVYYGSGLSDDQPLECNTEKMGDYEISLRRQLPMFDWDKYLGSLIFHGMYFSLGYIGFELSDPYDKNILYHAVDKLDLTGFKFHSWNNM